MENGKVTEDRMHGSIFVLLKRFVESAYDYSTWIKLLEAAGIRRAAYQMSETYPTQELMRIIRTAAQLTGIPVPDLMEKYGEFLVPDLLLIYKKYIRPEWNTYNMLVHTEAAMHGAVRKEDNRTSPPILSVTPAGDRQLLIDYHSKRRMAGVAVGIIKGIAKHYNESDQVTVTRLSAADEESVQIRVDFLG